MSILLRTSALLMALYLGGTANAEGRNEHRPVFSPNGQQLVFMSKSPVTNDDWELFLMDVDGRNLKRLTHHAGWDGYAVWNPDGTSIAFDRGQPDSTKKTPHIMDLTSGETKPLGEYDGWLSINDWRENTFLAFWEKDGQRDLYLLDRNGKITDRLTNTPDISEHDAHFSPDGTTIAFASGPSQGDGQTSLEIIDLATRARTTVKSSIGRIYGIDWSPNGASIAFTDAPGGDDDDADIFIYDTDSAAVSRCTTDTSWDHMPEWTPGGTSLMFTSYRTGEERLYVASCKGTPPRVWAGDSAN